MEAKEKFSEEKAEGGATMIEYALLVALISLALLAAVISLREQVSSTFSTSGSVLTQ